MKKTIAYAVLILLSNACGNSKETEQVAIKTDSVISSEAVITTETDKEGIIGVFDVNELLTLAIKDSAKMDEVGFKIAKAYGAIQFDLDNLNVEIAGHEGVLLYNNNPENFVFECVIPINKLPETKPKKATIVILEATKAIVYNYYGPYNTMFKAYEKLKDYMNENKLTQTGPVREFYITDSQAERDTAKWLSKIYIPVK